MPPLPAISRPLPRKWHPSAEYWVNHFLEDTFFWILVYIFVKRKCVRVCVYECVCFCVWRANYPFPGHLSGRQTHLHTHKHTHNSYKHCTHTNYTGHTHSSWNELNRTLVFPLNCILNLFQVQVLILSIQLLNDKNVFHNRQNRKDLSINIFATINVHNKRRRGFVLAT